MEVDLIGEQINHIASLYDKRFERFVYDIKRGRYPLLYITHTGVRNRVEHDLVELYVQGKLSHEGVVSLISDQIAMINLGWKTIELVPEGIRDMVMKVIDKGTDIDPVTGRVIFDETILDSGQ